MILRALTWLAIGIITLILFSFLASLFLFRGCGYEDSKLKLESITKTQWIEIVPNILSFSNNGQDFEVSNINGEKYVRRDWVSETTELNSDELKLIKELKDIGFGSIDFSSSLGRINISIGGCMDNKLYLHVKNIGKEDTVKVSITWGEHPLKEKILWQESE